MYPVTNYCPITAINRQVKCYKYRQNIIFHQFTKFQYIYTNYINFFEAKSQLKTKCQLQLKTKCQLVYIILIIIVIKTIFLIISKETAQKREHLQLYSVYEYLFCYLLKKYNKIN